MPIYEFSCQHCNTDFEELVPATRLDAEVRCPSCGHADVRRRLSVFGTSSGQSDTCDRACGLDGGFS